MVQFHQMTLRDPEICLPASKELAIISEVVNLVSFEGDLTFLGPKFTRQTINMVNDGKWISFIQPELKKYDLNHKIIFLVGLTNCSLQLPTQTTVKQSNQNTRCFKAEIKVTEETLFSTNLSFHDPRRSIQGKKYSHHSASLEVIIIGSFGL